MLRRRCSRRFGPGRRGSTRNQRWNGGCAYDDLDDDDGRAYDDGVHNDDGRAYDHLDDDDGRAYDHFDDGAWNPGVHHRPVRN